MMQRLVTVVLLIGSVGCSVEDGSGDGARTLTATWSSTGGFSMSVGDRRYLAQLGKGSEFWAIGEGFAAPLTQLPENLAHLAPGLVWPDIIVPDSVGPETELALYSLHEGKADELVAHLDVSPRGSEEVPYTTYYGYYTRCGNYCGPNEYYGCGACSPDPCSSLCWTQAHCGPTDYYAFIRSDDWVCGYGPEPYQGMCGDCTGWAYHYCYYSAYSQVCYD